MAHMMRYRGQRFGRITVISDSFRKNNATYVRGQCDCGNKSDYYVANLKGGKSTQCRKCGQQRANDAARAKAAASDSMGLAKTRLYHAWLRYRDADDLVEEWKSFRVVHDAIGGDRKGMFLRKKDRRLPLGPNNWEWSETPSRMRTGGRADDLDGKTLEDWSQELGITRERVRQLINKHGNIEAAIEHRSKPYVHPRNGGPKTKRCEQARALIETLADGELHTIAASSLPCSVSTFCTLIGTSPHRFKKAHFDNGATIVLQLRK